MCQRAEVDLECQPESVALGRQFIAATVLEWGVSEGDPAWDVLSDLLLVASEVLGNAVRACLGHIALSVEAHRGYFHLDVRDDNPSPAVRHVSDVGAMGGRGLAIVEALAVQWGQSPFNGATKNVWVDVALEPGSVLADGCHL